MSKQTVRLHASQRITGIFAGEVRSIELPAATVEVMRGMRWGEASEFFTPAFWFVQAWHYGFAGSATRHRLGRSLAEELAACLLGGHGMPAEVGLAAFAHLRAKGLLDPHRANEITLREALREPLIVNGRTIHYRFANQKAHYLARALKALGTASALPPAGRPLRNWLTTLHGIGPKTASWVVRNWLDSDDVAILDIHIHRAGVLTGFFCLNDRIDRDYVHMEQRFLSFCAAVSVRPSLMDAVMWGQMKEMGGYPVDLLNERKRGPAMTAAFA